VCVYVCVRVCVCDMECVINACRNRSSLRHTGEIRLPCVDLAARSGSRVCVCACEGVCDSVCACVCEWV